jgi:peptidoglycan hydrolase-like protein with peptidoglycan-binding domain
MIRAIRSFAVAGAAALIGAAMIVSPLAISSGFAQTTTPAAPAPTTPAPATPAPAAPAAPAPAPAMPAPAPVATPAPAAAAPAMPEKKMPEKKPVAYSRRSVEMVQAALNNKGANLEIDGTMNAATKAALKKYQAGNKLKATGAIDQATIKSLGIKDLKKWE